MSKPSKIDFITIGCLSWESVGYDRVVLKQLSPFVCRLVVAVLLDVLDLLP